MTLDHYLAYRRYWEIGAWALYFFLSFLASTGIAIFDLERRGTPFELWEPIVWETSSHLVLALLILLIVRFDRRFPIRRDTWPASLVAHGLFTVIYSLIHVSAMYWARVGIYSLIGNTGGYHWSHWWAEFGYEYLKDVRSYFFFLVIIYLYRFILRRLGGEAEFLSEGREEHEPVVLSNRFLIKKLGREFLIRADQIDWIEACGNYVNLHVGSRVYPLRETMARISERLHSLGFQRVHRGAIVNLDRIVELLPNESGDGEAILSTQVRVPISRRYRKELRERLS